jgi:uncharacterized protein (TIGR02246 family)
MAAADTVARQVDAYNAHDLEAFLSCYTDDVVITTGNGDVILDGINAVREQYAVWFTELPDLHAEVHVRLERGTWVVDDEHATATGLDLETLVAYHVTPGGIDRVVLMTAEPENAPTHR